VEQSTPSAPVVDIVAPSAVVVAAAPAAASMPATVASAPAAASTSAPAAPASVSRSSAVSSVASAQSVPVAPVASKPASAPLAQSAALSGPVPKGAHRIRFAFDSDAWVEVRDATGKIIFSRLNPAGSEQEVQGTAPLQLVIGNAPQVRLTVDGKAMELASRTTTNVARVTLP